MGLFSSSKIPKPALPKISIRLSTPSEKVFKPDDVVSGYVAFAPTVPIVPHAIEVSLFGQSLVWLRTGANAGKGSTTDYHHWRDNAPLFEVTTNVLPAFDSKAPTLQPGEKYTYPFQFQFPAGTGNSRFGQYNKDEDMRWTVGPHLLPPSFLHTGTHGTNMGEDADFAKIEYGIRARLICPGIGIARGQNLHDLVVTAPVLFVPLDPKPDASEGPLSVLRDSKTFKVQSSALTGQATSSIGFRQSMRDRFSSSTPKLEFEVAVEIPDLITSGSEFHFRVSFNVLSISDNVAYIPHIRFAILKLELQDLTAVRAQRDHEAALTRDGHHRNNRYENMPSPDAPGSKHEHIESIKRKTLLNSLPESATLELEEIPGGEKKAMEQASSCEAWFSARVPGFMPPSFKSFAINRNYRVKVKLGVEVGGKKFEHKVRSEIRNMRSAPA